MSPEQQRLDRINADIEGLEPTSRAIVEGTAAAIELACISVPQGLALRAITKVACATAVAMTGATSEPSKLIVVGGGSRQ